MKIVLVASHHWPLPTPLRTGDILVLDLAIALRGMGHDMTLCAPTGTAFPNLFEVPAAEGRGVPTAAEAEADLLRRAADLFASADIIHDFSVTKSICRAYQSKALCTPFSSSDGNNLSTLRNIVCQSHAQRERSFRGATDYEGTEWPDLAGPPQAPILDARVVHNGIDTEWYCPGDTPKEGFLLWLGRWSPQRGYKLAIELARANPDIQLVMSGERPADARFDPERNCALEAAELARGVPNIRFEWLPADEGEHQRMKRELYRRARAFLMTPLFREPFGLQQIEAMACGTPVIATPMGSIPEVLEQGVTGLIAQSCAVDDVAAAADGISVIEPAHCRSEAVRRFDRKVMATEYVKLYEKIADGWFWGPGGNPIPGFHKFVDTGGLFKAGSP